MKIEITKAIELAIQGKWDEAHELVAEMEHPLAFWLHAVLHKIEGDHSNSRYWYRMAKRSDDAIELADELLQIQSALKEEI